ncbi:hypothetical protein V2J09_020757 [Rumex salicifolius]
MWKTQDKVEKRDGLSKMTRWKLDEVTVSLIGELESGRLPNVLKNCSMMSVACGEWILSL